MNGTRQKDGCLFVFQLFHNILKILWFIYCKRGEKAAIMCIWKIEKLEKICEGYCTRMNILKCLVFAAQNDAVWELFQVQLLFYFIFFVTKPLKNLPQQKQVFCLVHKSLFVTVGAPARCREGRQRRRTQAQKITDAVERWILLAVKWPRPRRRSHFCPFCVGGGSVFGTWPLKTMRNLPKGRCWQL